MVLALVESKKEVGEAWHALQSNGVRTYVL
jgi:hypothetical protein